MTVNPEIQQLQQMVRRLESQTKQQLKDLANSYPDNNPVMGVVDCEQRTLKVLELFGCLSKHQARAFLHATETTAGVRKRALVELLAPWVDERWADLREEVAGLHLICGGLGRSVLRAVMQEVNKRRRQRGAVELASLDTLLQVMQNKAQQNGEELSDEEFVAVAPEVLKAFQLESDGSSVMVGGFGLKQLGWMREIKTLLKRDHPALADPFRGSAEDYYLKVAALYQAAADKGMGPLTAERQFELQQYAHRYPNVMFQDARGVRSWGGKWANKRVKSTSYQAVPVQGPRPVTETRTLTNYGEALLKIYKERDVLAQFGFAHSVHLVEQQAMAVERKRQELLTADPHPEYGPTWRVDVSLADLGFEMVEVESEVDAPDKPYESLFSGQSTAELIQEMAEALEQLGYEGGSDAARVLP